jgi:nitrite reductase/ring-hydroxylating ferredoxin subunit
MEIKMRSGKTNKVKEAMIGALLLLAFVAGCIGGQSQETNNPTSEPPSTSGSPAGPNGLFVAKIAQVQPGATFDFTFNGSKAILVNIDGTYFAYVNICPHKGCPTAYDGSKLTCTCHGSQFDPKTGDVLKGPATSPLTTINVEVVGDSVYVK